MELECGFDFHGIITGGAAVIVVIQIFLVQEVASFHRKQQVFAVLPSYTARQQVNGAVVGGVVVGSIAF